MEKGDNCNTTDGKQLVVFHPETVAAIEDQNQCSDDTSKQLVVYNPSSHVSGQSEGNSVINGNRSPWAYHVQCAKCLKLRPVPTLEKYESIREDAIRQPFSCEMACQWRPGSSCEDTPDVFPDETSIWAIDYPGIPQPPPGWRRVVSVRAEGGTQFADVYYYTPAGKRLRSMGEVKRFLAENLQNENDISKFSFKRPKPLNKNYVRKHTRPCSTVTRTEDLVDARSVSGNFIPQMIHVNDGEDVVHAIMSVPDQRSRVISILSAKGWVSQFTLHHPRFPGGTRTYEGRFEIITLTGRQIPCYHNGIKAISGGVTAKLATPDGLVSRGLVTHLFASGPVQVEVASSPVPAV